MRRFRLVAKDAAFSALKHGFDSRKRHPHTGEPASLLRDAWCAGPFGVAAGLLALVWFRAYRAFADIDHLLVVRFTGGHGIDVLGSAADIFSFLGIGSFVVALNILLSHALLQRERAYASVFAFLTLLLVILLFIAVHGIIRVNA